MDWQDILMPLVMAGTAASKSPASYDLTGKVMKGMESGSRMGEQKAKRANEKEVKVYKALIAQAMLKGDKEGLIALLSKAPPEAMENLRDIKSMVEFIKPQPTLKEKATEAGVMAAATEAGKLSVRPPEPTPEEKIKTIENEAAARARGTAAGAPPKPETIEMSKIADGRRHTVKVVRGSPAHQQALNAKYQEGTISEKEGWKPESKEEKIEVATAGAPSITQQVGAEKFGIQTGVMTGEIRTEILKDKKNQDLYITRGNLFNKHNAFNEVAYWDDTVEKSWGKDKPAGTKIIKLNAAAIKKGWTPSVIQDITNKGYSVKEVLDNAGLLGGGITILPPEAVRAGWSVTKIREAAKKRNKSVKEVLEDLGIK